MTNQIIKNNKFKLIILLVIELLVEIMVFSLSMI